MQNIKSKVLRKKEIRYDDETWYMGRTRENSLLVTIRLRETNDMPSCMHMGRSCDETVPIPTSRIETHHVAKEKVCVNSFPQP